jgi:enoyl-CoA hydratase/carnithine racemase
VSPPIQLKKHLPSATIVLNRPAARNALSRQVLDEIRQALQDFHLERRVRAVILTGAGDAFCAGLDLAEMLETSQRDDAFAHWHDDAVQYKDLIEMMLEFPKPIIAAVNGVAAGAGAGLVLASDLVLGTAEARFGFPECRRGLVAGLSAPLLYFRAGGGLTARLLLSGELIDGAEAQRLGIFHELVDRNLIWARAHQLAEQCALAAPEALQLTKRVVNETLGEHLGVLMAAGAAASATSRTTEAAQEGLQAFSEKRPPNWP